MSQNDLVESDVCWYICCCCHSEHALSFEMKIHALCNILYRNFDFIKHEFHYGSITFIENWYFGLVIVIFFLLN